MRYLSAAHTDVGIVKRTNQDSFCIEVAKTKMGHVAMAVLCDGMGGLQKGEVASANVVLRFSKWFETELPKLSESPIDFQDVIVQWNRIINERNETILSYGARNKLSLGTTLTTVLMINDRFLTAQVGDSRAYRLNSSGILQITKDQSLVAKEVEEGKLTPEQARHDSRRNVLLQCIGATKKVVPAFTTGEIKCNDVFLICSDGFVHEVSDQEVQGVLAGELLTNETIMKKSLVDLIELNKERKERDNITALLLKAVR